MQSINKIKAFGDITELKPKVKRDSHPDPRKSHDVSLPALREPKAKERLSLMKKTSVPVFSNHDVLRSAPPSQLETISENTN